MSSLGCCVAWCQALFYLNQCCHLVFRYGKAAATTSHSFIFPCLFFFSQPSDFSISLKAVGKNKHFKVQQQDGVYCIGQRRFSSMDELVEHYKKAPIFTSEEGDKLYLVKPLAWICRRRYLPSCAPPFPSFLLLSLAPFRSNFKDYLTFQSPTMPPLLLGAVAT